ncbi:cytochrome c biogenesis protein ResB [bacterium]|nr:cytochrome c biogenesis protein ResB [bacterium]
MSNLFKRNPILRFLASVKLALILFLIFAFAIAVATFIESRYGTPAARAMVYGARWFELVLTLFVISLIASFFTRMPYRRTQAGFVMIHLSVIIILISAGVTRFFGYEGMMPIREGASTDYILSSRDYVQLGQGEDESHWPVWLYKPGENKLKKKLSVGGLDYKVEITEYWPHFEEVLAPAEDGQPALTFATVGAGGMERRTLFENHHMQLEAVTLRFHAGGLPAETPISPFGALNVSFAGHTSTLDVNFELPRSVEASGHQFTITEFLPDYAARGGNPREAEMANPMIRVEIKGPNGETGERILFALFPDFSLGHGGDDDPFTDLDMSYSLNRGIDFAVEEGTLFARSSFDLSLMDMASTDVDQVFPAGERFEFETGVLYQDGEFRIVPVDFYPSAAWKAGLSENQSNPAAARLRVAAPGGPAEEMLVTRGERRPRTMELDGRELSLGFGPVLIPLDYSLYLDDFLLITYPGSENPASYESHVKLFDEERGIDGNPVRIYMNHPLTHRGNKHFQSSYDPDRGGTVLSVNHDPGKWPTYLGYAMISLGFILVFFKEIIWRRPKRKAENA